MTAAVFTNMLPLGLRLGREHIRAARERPAALGMLVFAVVALVPAVAVTAGMLLGVRGAAAAGIVLMAISPGAPIALRRAIEAGGRADFAPALHVVLLAAAIGTVPASIAILDILFEKDFAVSPLHVAQQVFVVQVLPLSLGAALRAWRPALAQRLEARLARLANLLLVGLVPALAIALYPLIFEIGWAPLAFGVGLSVCALGIGAACAGRDPGIRRAGAVAAAMRNPGLALLIAAVNKMPALVVAAVFDYAIGLLLVVTAFILWQRKAPSPPGAPRLDV